MTFDIRPFPGAVTAVERCTGDIPTPLADNLRRRLRATYSAKIGMTMHLHRRAVERIKSPLTPAWPNWIQARPIEYKRRSIMLPLLRGDVTSTSSLKRGRKKIA